MEHYKNLSLENITLVIDGVVTIEQWCDIDGYEGYYQCSDFGRVKSLSRIIPDVKLGTKLIKDRIRKQFLSVNGYLQLYLNKFGEAKRFSSHRIIGNEFIINPQNKGYINHKNLIRTDNTVINLEWLTKSEDNIHSYINGTRRKTLSNNIGIKNPTIKIVYQFDMYGSFIKKFYGTMEAERVTGISHKMIGRVCIGKRPHTHGFIWEYESNIKKRFLNNNKILEPCQ